MQKSCNKMLPCGHACKGCAGETKCPPCLEPECIAKMPENLKPNVTCDDFCTICYATAVGQEPCV
jgi:E3 ubiquitin-protein ligase MYCBP2